MVLYFYGFIFVIMYLKFIVVLSLNEETSERISKSLLPKRTIWVITSHFSQFDNILDFFKVVISGIDPKICTGMTPHPHLNVKLELVELRLQPAWPVKEVCSKSKKECTFKTKKKFQNYFWHWKTKSTTIKGIQEKKLYRKCQWASPHCLVPIKLRWVTTEENLSERNIS